MSSELAYEASDEASENELLERSLSVWKGWNSIEWEEFAPIALDLHTACSIGHYEWVRSIILKGEDPTLDRRNHGGWTPLMYACYIGHDNIVNLLINAGCSMNMKNSRGHTPLMLAASCGNENVARTLVRKGAELELIDKTGWTALFHATYAGHQNFVAFLLDAGANKDAIEPSSGTTPFMEAAAEGHEIIVQLFLQHGVNVNAKAHNDDTARSLAQMNGNMKIVSLIDNHILPISCLRSEAGLDFYLSSSDDAQPSKQHSSIHNLRLKSKGPSIRDGPEAIARMIDRTRYTETVGYTNLLVPKGYMSFPVNGASDKEETKMSYRDVTSPINPEDYKDSSGSRAMSDLDDFNDDSNAFTKTGAITIKSSSSSSGGLIAALGLSRDGSLDSDDSHSFDQAVTSSEDIFEDTKVRLEDNRVKVTTSDGLVFLTQESPKYGSEQLNSLLSANKSVNAKPHDDVQSLQTPVGDYKAVEQVGLNVQQQVSEASSRDYFSMDSSFPDGTADPQSSEADKRNSQLLQDESLPLPISHLTLPKDNMTQVEIVNRFLKNLTVNNPETSPGQNRWADETGINQASYDGLNGTPHFPHQNGGHNNTTPASGRVAVTSRKPYLSKSHDCKDDDFECTSKDSVLNLGTSPGQADCPKKDVSQASSSEVVGRSPGCSGKNNTPDVPGQYHLQSDLNHHPNDVLEKLSNSSWTHHPHLGRHHLRHSRHHHNHNLLSRVADSPGGNIRNTPPRLSSTQTSSPHLTDVNQAEVSTPFSQDLPQEYFYSDIETASHFHQHMLGAAVHSPSPTGVNTANSLVDYSTNLATSPYPLSHLRTPPLNVNSMMDLQPSNETLLSSAIPQTCQISHFPHSIDQTGLKSKDSFLAQKQQSFSPAVAMAAPAGSHQLTPQITPPQASSYGATVIIPGHATSQPVCSTIGWDQVGLPDSLGPRDLPEMLTQLGLVKYLDKFVDQDVDLQVFLSLTDNDLKELGVKLFGPRKKMTNAIARWHSTAPIACSSLEQAYADRLEGEMQELAIQLNQAYENHERLKAQVLQEQQLRSVTESCLMEERASWEQAQQTLLNTRAKMRKMGDLMSRLRLCHKMLKKQLEKVSKQLTEESMQEDTKQLASSGNETTDAEIDQSYQATNENCPNPETEKKIDSSVSNFSTPGSELFKKSEKCLKEMHQILTSLVVSAEHLLKSTPNMDNIDKNRT